MRVHALRQEFQGLLGGLVAVFGIKTPQKCLSLAVGKSFQIGLAPWVIAGLHLLRDGTKPVQVVVHDIAHQPDEHQVDRIAEGLAH